MALTTDDTLVFLSCAFAELGGSGSHNLDYFVLYKTGTRSSETSAHRYVMYMIDDRIIIIIYGLDTKNVPLKTCSSSEPSIF